MPWDIATFAGIAEEHCFKMNTSPITFLILAALCAETNCFEDYSSDSDSNAGVKFLIPLIQAFMNDIQLSNNSACAEDMGTIIEGIRHKKMWAISCKYFNFRSYIYLSESISRQPSCQAHISPWTVFNL